MEVTIDIRKHFIRDYLGYIFPKDDRGYHIVTRNNPAGQYICSMVEYSYKPPRIARSVTLDLPACDALKSGENRFIYISFETQEKINDYLEAQFDLDFERYLWKGLQMHLPQKDVIYAFIQSRKLASFEEDIETLKKRAYRQYLHGQKAIFELLRNKANYIDRVIGEQLRPLSV